MVKDGQRCELAVRQGFCLLVQASTVPRVLWRFRVVRQAEAEVRCQHPSVHHDFPVFCQKGVAMS